MSISLPFAEKIRTEAQIATAAVGSITEATQAEQIVKNQQADIVLLATEMLRDPYWSYHAALELQPKDTAKTLLPVQYGGRV